MSSASPSGPLLVLVPRGDGPGRLAAVPGVRAVPYDPADPVPPAAGRDAEAVVVDGSDVPATLELLGRLPRLRLVQTLSAGFDAWEGRVPDGVAISNVRGAHGRATAELAVALLLAHVRELPRFGAAQARGAWAPTVTASLAGARVLLLGAGDLARHAAAMLAPFGARTTLVGRTARDGVVALADVDALLPAQDAVVCVLPLNDATRGVIDAAFLARLRDGAIVVNAGRGPLVDTDALLAELRAGRLRAALDVTDPEPLPAGHPLWDAPGLLVTPHVGGDTTGAEDRQWRVAAEALAAFARGERPATLVAGDLP
ncbi:NAD(P)-dependent oxidoreductase [Patulibacter sp. SYSU D01012]|uniref:NAD(P)-dependent oxidoreductase n=1 Tax=Patulibacter sp. SYSU D01012 TaxID=2817381 RepID=UPI001B3173D3|nr:NAD(P)-dependent oxidoreductase [Patulibacter sp. SYSU D01012]